MSEVAGILWNLRALEWYDLPGRGPVAIVECPLDWDKNELPARLAPGMEVLIDGKAYTIQGIESYAIQHISKGQKIGLLVTS